VPNQILFIFSAGFLALATAAMPAFAEVIPLSSLNLVGTSQIIPGGTLRLTDNTDPNPSGPSPAGAAWTKNTFDVADPFSANFHFQMTDPTGHLDGKNGGDGIAFLIQDSTSTGAFGGGFGDTALGLGAGGMGFMGIKDSVAVMLDTYRNNAPNFYGDPSNNYIAVNTQGTGTNVPHHFCDSKGQLTADPSIGSDISLPCTKNPELGMTGYGGVNPLSVNMDDGKVHDVGITYTGTMLDIYLDSSLVLGVSLDLATTLNLQGGTGAFLGFTAGTRFAYQNQDILDFAITPEPAWGQLWVPLAMIVAAALARKSRRSKV
jgi:hypothetical protein